MDNVRGLLSAEALRLLENYGSASNGLSRPQECTHGAYPSLPEATQRPSWKPKRPAAPDAIPGLLTLVPTNSAAPKSKRAKFEPNRRHEVANIRKIGACIRCRQLKISVSEISPFLLISFSVLIEF